MVTSLSDVLEDPHHVVKVLEDELFGVCVDQLLLPRRGGVVLDITFEPLPELKAAGYVDERARMSIRTTGDVYAFPLGQPRPWKHRQPSPCAGLAMGHFAAELCLFYPRDPNSLRWDWADGLEQLVTRVHRHLFYEEHWRRGNPWPVEDAPHDDPGDAPHPVRSRRMREEAERWVS
jgi:hypothetical protein